MRFPGVMAAAALSVLVLHPMAGLAAQQETEVVDRTVRLPENGTLRLRNFSGDIRITGSGGQDVVIHAVRTAERRKLDNIELAIETSGSAVSIDANRKRPGYREENDNVVRTTFEIQVPASAALDVDAFSSELHVSGVSGQQRLKTFSGDITVTDARSAVHANTFEGRIDVDVRAAGGDPNVVAETFSGAIGLRIDGSARGAVDFDSFSGRFDSDLPLTLRSSSRRRVDAELPGGPSAGRLRLKTFSGDVRVTR